MGISVYSMSVTRVLFLNSRRGQRAGKPDHAFSAYSGRNLRAVRHTRGCVKRYFASIYCKSVRRAVIYADTASFVSAICTIFYIWNIIRAIFSRRYKRVKPSDAARSGYQHIVDPESSEPSRPRDVSLRPFRGSGQVISDELRGRYGCIIACRYDFGCDELCKLTI